MTDAGMPIAGFFLVSAILLELLGSLMLVLGYKAKIGALMLIVFLIPATLIFHLEFGDRIQVTQFFKNLAILGGLLMPFALGSGYYSIDSLFDNSRR
jgi:putative oxidoreductase